LRIGIDARGIYEAIDGIGRYSLNLIRALASIDHRNEYFLLKNREVRSRLVRAPNFSEISVGFRHLSIRSVAYLPVLIKKLDLDVFHAPFFVCPAWGMRNTIVTVHDLMALTFPGFFSGRSLFKEKAALLYHRLFVPLSIRKAKRIIAVSESTKRAVIDELGVEPDKILVIYEGVDECFNKTFTERDLRDFRVRKGLPENYLLYVGNMKPYKNVPLMISALAALKETGRLKHKLVMAGKKDRFFPLVHGAVKDRQLMDDVIFLGYVDDDELPLLFKNAQIFLFPSLSEGFGLPALEAMSLGVPTIVSNVSSLPEVVGNGAHLVDPDNPVALADAIAEISHESATRVELARKGIERSKAFSWENAARQTSELYRSFTPR
jgi:glycosyltransferase involved in cell wall biosynthesis